MFRYPSILLLLLSCLFVSCGGAGKGCGPAYNPNVMSVLYRDYFYLELGELTPDKVKDGVLVAEAKWADDYQKAKLAGFIERAKKQDGYDEDNYYYIHVGGYLEHEDFLHKDFVYGSEVYPYDKYFCSDMRLFTDNSVFPDFEQGLPFALGTVEHFNVRTRLYKEGQTGTEQSEYHNPGGFAIYSVPYLGVEKGSFFDGNFPLRIEAGTSITKDNVPKGKFFVRLYLRMVRTPNGLVSLEQHEPTTPKCGPYLQSNNAKDMGADMNDMGDMSSSDASPDMPDMTGDMPVGDMGKDATQDMPDMSKDIESSDMPKDVGMD